MRQQGPQNKSLIVQLATPPLQTAFFFTTQGFKNLDWIIANVWPDLNSGDILQMLAYKV